MPEIVKQENETILFNVYASNNPQSQNRITMSQLASEMPIIELESVTEGSKVQDKSSIMSKILKKAEEEQISPILNICYDSNRETPLLDDNDLVILKNKGVKVSFIFDNYDPKNETLFSSWKGLLAKADHVFFANEKDSADAVAMKHVTEEKSSNIQRLSATKLQQAEILKRPPNILISDKLPNKKILDQVVDATKQLGNSRIIIVNPPSSADDITNIIASKFDIKDQDHLVGMKLEIQDILKDKVNGAKNLEKYVQQISEQFKKDHKKAEINPIDIYFDLSDQQKLQNIYQQAKYTIPQDETKNYNNGCIPLENLKKTNDIVNEIKQRENNNGINELAINDMQEHLDKSKQSAVWEIINDFKKIVVEKENDIDFLPHGGEHLTTESYLYENGDIASLLKLSLKDKEVSIQPTTRLDDKEELKHFIIESISAVNSGKNVAIIPIIANLG